MLKGLMQIAQESWSDPTRALKSPSSYICTVAGMPLMTDQTLCRNGPWCRVKSRVEVYTLGMFTGLDDGDPTEDRREFLTAERIPCSYSSSGSLPCHIV